ILQVLGVCPELEYFDTKKGSAVTFRSCLISPFVRNGSMEDFFAKERNSGKAAQFLVSWALDIATGLAYLHKHGFVHRDIAARNVLVDEKHHAVISDFDFARRVDQSGALTKTAG